MAGAYFTGRSVGNAPFDLAGFRTDRDDLVIGAAAEVSSRLPPVGGCAVPILLGEPFPDLLARPDVAREDAALRQGPLIFDSDIDQSALRHDYCEAPTRDWAQTSAPIFQSRQ